MNNSKFQIPYSKLNSDLANLEFVIWNLELIS